MKRRLVCCIFGILNALPMTSPAEDEAIPMIYLVPGPKAPTNEPCDIMALARSYQANTSRPPLGRSSAAAWLNQATRNRTAIFNNALITHYKVNYYQKDISASEYRTDLDIFILQFSKNKATKEALRVIEQGLNPKGPSYSFWSHHKNNTVFLIAYPNIMFKNDNALLTWSQQIVKECAQNT